MICFVCKKEFVNHKKYEVKTCSKECAGIFRNKEATQINLWFMNFDSSIIEEKIEDYHTPAMIYDFLLRDFGLPKKWSLKQIRNFLLKKFKFKENNECQKKPQWFKLQYKYPKNFSFEDIRSDIIRKSRIGQEVTIKLREKKGNLGNPKFKKEDSPLCEEFYIVRGFDSRYAKEKIQEICLAGALASIKLKGSSLEKTVKDFLKKENIDFVEQFDIRLLNEEKIYNKRKYIYDFCIPSLKTIIECNGTYWHADPEVYKSGDYVKLPRHGKVLVDKIWKIDKHKQKVANSRGYKTFFVWEERIDECLNGLKLNL